MNHKHLEPEVLSVQQRGQLSNQSWVEIDQPTSHHVGPRCVHVRQVAQSYATTNNPMSWQRVGHNPKYFIGTPWQWFFSQGHGNSRGYRQSLF